MVERVLIVDDDPVQRRLLDNMARKFGYEPLLADSGEAAMALLASPAPPQISCVVLDLVMPDLDGLGVLARMRAAGINVPVIVQTAHGGIDNVISAMRAGAADFVVKPVGAERLQVSLRNALATHALTGEVTRIKRSQSGTLTFRDIVTQNAAMRAVLRAAEKAAGSNIPVLIEGESGVGKELIARAIHGSGERRAKPFIAVNCGAIPENLVESILFGHEKGAFTGATERHMGKFAEANGGTLFLDEIGELPLAAQVKLLRAIQEGEIEPVGARKTIKVDVRLISATNRNLLDDVKQGRFREDLFYRLHVYPIAIPALRARPEDIFDLVRHFLARIAAEEGKRIRAVSSEAIAMLGAYRWPGNVRQLENAVFRAVVLAESDMIGVAEFPQIAAQVAGGGALPESHPSPSLAAGAPMSVGTEAAAWIDVRPVLAPEFATQHAMSSPPGSICLLDPQGDVRPLEEVEKEVIRFAISHYREQMSEVARRLRIGRSTLYRKLESLGLEGGSESEHSVAASPMPLNNMAKIP
jgi:DNA-binding NtrC family response regulator